MNKFLSKIIVVISFCCQSTYLLAMEGQPNFGEEIDKLIFVSKAQTQYLGNWLSLIREDSPESQGFLENFIFPIAGKSLGKQRAICDFYIDYLYSKFIEESLVKIKNINNQEAKGDINSALLQNTLSQFYTNIRRAYDITIGDLVKRGGDYLSSKSDKIKVNIDVKSNRRSYSCEPNDFDSIYNIFVLTSLDKNEEGIAPFSSSLKAIFEDDPVTLHYFNQALTFEKISNHLSKYIIKVVNKRYFSPEIGRLSLVYDNIFNAVIDDNKFNTNILLMVALEEMLRSGKCLEKKQNDLLNTLRNRYKNKHSVEFLLNEIDFIDKQLAIVFPSTKSHEIEKSSNGGWGSNPVMDQFNKKNKPNKQASRRKQQNKNANNKIQKNKEIIKISETSESANKNIDTLVKQDMSISKMNSENRQVLGSHNTEIFFLNTSLAYSNDPYSIIIRFLDLKSLCSLICTTKALSPLFRDARDKISISEIDYAEELFDFDDWYRDNVIKYSHENKVISQNSLMSNNIFSAPQFYGLGETFLEVVFGHGYAEVTTKHFNSFLKQAGGYKVKMGQNGYLPISLKDKSVETHYVVPNLLATQHEMLFCLYLVHQPHAASIPFPKKTLYSFIRRDLAKAGYAR